MKRINIIIAALALLLTVSCGRKVEFVHETFATLYDVSYSVNEDIGTLRIPVTIYNPTGGELQVRVVGIDGEGKNAAIVDKDYVISSPALGILTFSGETATQDIEIDITPMLDDFTGAKKFSVRIESATEGLAMGALNTAAVTIQDLNHPLAPFIGAWTGTLVGQFIQANYQYQTTINVSADETDPTYTKLIFDGGIDPFAKAMGLPVGVFSATVKDNVATLTSGQPHGYEAYALEGFNTADFNDATAYDDVHFSLNEDGTMKLDNAFTFSSGNYYMEVYNGGVVFTKR